MREKDMQRCAARRSDSRFWHDDFLHCRGIILNHDEQEEGKGKREKKSNPLCAFVVQPFSVADGNCSG